MLKDKIEGIETTSEFDRFQSHLAPKNNKRIIFSAPYGSGKTYFLQNFFSKNSVAFNSITINPIKYSVSQNHDIFELIKVDIISQLFENEYIKKEKSSSDFGSVSKEWFVKEKFASVIGGLAKTLPLLNPDPTTSALSKLIEFIPGLKREFDEYSEKKTKEMNLYEETLFAFLEKSITISGQAYELDDITFIIRNVLTRIKGTADNQKENILIIDDFDRLDPEHIFRVLNILSVHNDYWDQDNKFGFDKIIVVCDIDKLEKLFEHRYGPAADFGGYIDKFCSTHYFRFNIENEILSFLTEKMLSQSLGSSPTSLEEQVYLLAAILSHFVRKRKLTLRKIIKSNFQFVIPPKQAFKLEIDPRARIPFVHSDLVYANSADLPFLITIKMLSTVWGDYKLFMNDLVSECSNSTEIVSFFNRQQAVSIAQALVIPYHVVTSKDVKALLLRQINDPYSALPRYKEPEVTLLGFNFLVRLSYDLNNPYKGNTGIFTNVYVFEIQNPYDPSPRQSFTFGQLFSHLLEIINSFGKKGLLSGSDFI